MMSELNQQRGVFNKLYEVEDILLNLIDAYDEGYWDRWGRDVREAHSILTSLMITLGFKENEDANE